MPSQSDTIIAVALVAGLGLTIWSQSKETGSGGALVPQGPKGKNKGPIGAPEPIQPVGPSETVPAVTLDGRERQTMDLDGLYRKYGRKQNIDPKLLKAIAMVESSQRPQAVNPADPSYGLMQILCRDENGDGVCDNNLNVQGWPANRTDLLDPNFNLHIGSQILRWNIDTFGFKRGIAVYNAWNARKAPKEGPFPNQSYVDKVLGTYRQLGGQVPGETNGGGGNVSMV